MQLVMACGLLAMLLALGPTLSEGAAGCFQAVSGDVDETAARVVKRAPPTTRVQINTPFEPSDAASQDVSVNEDDFGGEVASSIPSADSAGP